MPSIRNTKSPGLPSLSTTSSSTRPLPLDQPQLRPSHSDDGEGDEGGDLFLNDLYDHTEPSCARDRLSAPQAPQVFRDSRSKITHAEPTAEPRTFRSPSSLASRPAQNPYATPASTSKKRRREENLASGSDECRTKSKTSGIRTLSISELMDQERERRRRPSDGLQHPSTEKFLPCQPASQAGVATDMPQDLEAILQQLPQTLQSLTNILTGPQSPMTLVRDLATKVNEQRAHIQRLELKLLGAAGTRPRQLHRPRTTDQGSYRRDVRQMQRGFAGAGSGQPTARAWWSVRRDAVQGTKEEVGLYRENVSERREEEGGAAAKSGRLSNDLSGLQEVK